MSKNIETVDSIERNNKTPQATVIKVPVRTRWPMRQVGECEAVVEIRLENDGNRILDTDFVRNMNLSDEEYHEACIAACKAIVIVR